MTVKPPTMSWIRIRPTMRTVRSNPVFHVSRYFREAAFAYGAQRALGHSVGAVRPVGDGDGGRKPVAYASQRQAAWR